MRLADVTRCLLDRVRCAYRSIITWLNSLGALVAAYALQNPVISDRVLFFIPEGPMRDAASVILPIAWFWIVQKGKKIDEKRQAGP